MVCREHILICYFSVSAVLGHWQGSLVSAFYLRVV